MQSGVRLDGQLADALNLVTCVVFTLDKYGVDCARTSWRARFSKVDIGRHIDAVTEAKDVNASVIELLYTTTIDFNVYERVQPRSWECLN